MNDERMQSLAPSVREATGEINRRFGGGLDGWNRRGRGVDGLG